MSNYPYRQGANAFVIDNENNFLLVQKVGYGTDQWDIPGGGLIENENPNTAILRELKEELGSTNFEILKECSFKIKYEWPKEAQESGFASHHVWWRGQEKNQFLVKFTGDKKKILIQKDEIREVRWVPLSRLQSHFVFKGQWENAKKVLEEFGFQYNT